MSFETHATVVVSYILRDSAQAYVLGTWPTPPWQPEQSVVKVCLASTLGHPGADDLVVLVIDLLLQQHLVHHRDEDGVFLAELDLK